MGLPAAAINYYLSDTGDDAAGGTSPLTPWRSLDKLNTISLSPGDSVFFACGSTFFGQFFLFHSGTETAPIYFGPYGSGPLPVISGTVTLTSWQPHTSEIFKTTLEPSPAQVFIGGNRALCARYPNQGFLRMSATYADTAFSCSALTQPDGYWNGAVARLRLTQTRWYAAEIAQFSAAQTTLAFPTPAPLLSNAAFYLDNHFAALDTFGEWFYDSVTHQLFLYTNGTDPAAWSITASIAPYGFLIGSNVHHIHIDRLHFLAQTEAAVLISPSAHALSFTGCSFTFQLAYAIKALDTHQLFVADARFEDIAGMAISIQSARRCTIQNCSFRRIGLIPGWGLNVDNAQSAVEFAATDSSWVAFNQMDSIGSIGLYADMENSRVQANWLRNTMLWTNRLGAIYVYAINEKNNLFQHNIIVHAYGEATYAAYGLPEGSGIFFDGPTTHCILYANTIAYATHGIRLARGATLCTLRQNLIYGCTSSQLLMEEGPTPQSTSHHLVHANVFFSIDPHADPVRLISPFNEFMPAHMDSNYYFNPYSYVSLVRNSPPPGSDFPRYYTLPLWQQTTGLDAASKAAFLYRTPYQITSSSGVELISNGHFTANFDGWINLNPDFLWMLLDNSTPLDFGCLKLAFKPTSIDTFAAVKNKPFPLDSGNFYLLQLSTWAQRHGTALLKIKQDVDPFYFVSPPLPLPIAPARMNCMYVFQAVRGFEKTRLSVELSSLDSLFWLDNVSLQEVSLTKLKPESSFRLFINHTQHPLSFDLADTVFYDLDQQPVTQTLTLPPFSAQVLIFDSSLINSQNDFSSSVSWQIWPNPVPSGNPIWLSRPDNNLDAEVSFVNIVGAVIWRAHWPKGTNAVHLTLPSNLSPGCFLVRIQEKNKTATLRLIVH
ncbi:MAG: right-handed parallel beta-helix repeat-containing protein [Chitinophagales bacterium]|nr:right-handed parallel beta-helix repeat-containing protein [Chitinophagales bacterium]MDW8427013.1 right-handed parallel beta-helix repeat-containing protein [Chitinophagales bacterium]